MNDTSFAVCSMVRESLADLVRFADFYAKAGAAEILVFHDDSADPQLRASLEQIPGVIFHQCDDNWWNARGGRPEVVENRQRACMHHALATTQCAWLLGCDADEFMSGAAPIREFLAAVPDHLSSIQIAPAEAVFGPDDDIFGDDLPSYYRLPTRHRKFGHALAFALHGLDGRKFYKGLLGHTEGKSFLRTSARFTDVRLHCSTDEAGRRSLPQDRVAPGAPKMRIYHQDALSYPRWLAKCRLRQGALHTYSGLSRERIRQLKAFERAAKSGEGALCRLYSRLYRLNFSQHAILRRLGLLEQRDLFAQL